MFVAMNRLVALAAFAGRIEQGFAQRAPEMAAVPGFVDFRLLRVHDYARHGEQDQAQGADEGRTAHGNGKQVTYIAETTFQDEASYQAWTQGDAFARAHGGGGQGGSGSPMTATLEIFDVV